MTPYHESIWAQAPVGATHWGIVGIAKWFIKVGDSLHVAHLSGGRGNQDFSRDVTDLHPRPQAYRSASDLIAEYRKEHGADIEQDVENFLMAGDKLTLEHLLDDALFHITLIEKHLAAERARIEGTNEAAKTRKE